MINTLPRISIVYDRHKRATASKASSIEICIAYKGKQKYLNTGIRVLPKCWKRGEVVCCPEAIEYNQVIQEMVTDVRQSIYEMLKEGHTDLSELPYRLEKKKRQCITFIEYCKARSQVRKYGKAKDCRERYDRFLRLFEQWGMIKNFEDITEEKIIAYDKYLSAKGMKPYSKWNNYHRFLNTFIIDAINDGLLLRNPYKRIDIDKGDKVSIQQKHLTPEEFQKIKTVELPTESLRRVRDIFVFQTYTCLSYSDLRDFCADRLHSVGGMKVYTGKRSKTKETFTVPMLQPALEILDKYNDKLPIISNVNYNAYLKLIAQAAGIDKPVSSHWARHTGATLLLNKGVPMQIISKVCGHSSTRITEQIYAKLLDKTVVESFVKAGIKNL